MHVSICECTCACINVAKPGGLVAILRSEAQLNLHYIQVLYTATRAQKQLQTAVLITSFFVFFFTQKLAALFE